MSPRRAAIHKLVDGVGKRLCVTNRSLLREIDWLAPFAHMVLDLLTVRTWPSVRGGRTAHI
jgi:hypothetical protein